MSAIGPVFCGYVRRAEIEKFNVPRPVYFVSYENVSGAQVAMDQPCVVCSRQTFCGLGGDVEGDCDRYLAVACQCLGERFAFDILKRRVQLATAALAEIG